MVVRDTLITLYHLDRKLSELDAILREAKADALDENKTAESLRADQSQVTQELEQARAKVSANEKEAARLENLIAERRQRLHAIRTNKAYQALLLEIDTLQSEKSAFEEAAVQDLEEVNRIEARLADLSDRLEEQQRREHAAEQRLARLHEEHDSQLEQLRNERRIIAEQLPSAELALYDRAFERCEEEPLAAVEEQDRRQRDYTCGGCFMQVPLERINQLLISAELVQCPNCTRVLYLDEELRASFVEQTTAS